LLAIRHRKCFSRQVAPRTTYQRIACDGIGGGLYRRDETFSRARELATSGALAMTHWNEAEIPSPHRDQIYRRHGIQERLSVVNADSPDDMLAINLYRFDDTGRFRDHEIDAAQAIGRPVLSCVKKHLQVLGKLKRVSQNPASIARLVLLERCPALTARELDVCERLCRGWTYDGIALDLGLSVPSVKTYRARAFDRLGIHFRNELFSIVVGTDRSP
jgi:DNA-binding CsgD family transcriptional regulator